ncbi:metalloregulator ArsR/SmtB family transcription factor [Streptomyces spiramenti]|uniref:Winged helix-turn-helix transcriptional regulator n=1 Tax=Streptomyces spiramenti TaxID=2720606 RepID=A0ABX1AH00_9ACTN|nr:winged helix-turn-helix transcriptional regulator [Streptomyces spiramenti]
MEAFELLADPVRRRVLELLADGERTSGELSDVAGREFGISQPAVSRHLRLLREGGLVEARPVGARRVYVLRVEALRPVGDWLERFRRDSFPPLDALATEVARGKRRRRLAAAAGGDAGGSTAGETVAGAPAVVAARLPAPPPAPVVRPQEQR